MCVHFYWETSREKPMSMTNQIDGMRQHHQHLTVCFEVESGRSRTKTSREVFGSPNGQRESLWEIVCRFDRSRNAYGPDPIPGDLFRKCYFFHLATVSRVFLSRRLWFSPVTASLVDCGFVVLLASKTTITTTFPLAPAALKGGSWITTPTKSTSCSHN